MGKYIDSEKLIAEIERRLAAYPKNFDKADNKIARLSTDGRIVSLKALLPFIDSLQQEPPKFKVGDTIHKIGENTVFPMTIERISDGDYVCVTEHQQSFINIKFQDDYELIEQEQPKVDLEDEAVMFCFDNGINITPSQAREIASYFYELGLNERKEDEE